MYVMAKYTLTADGKEKLQAEYELLTGTRRKEIAEKLMRGRQRVAAQKGDQSASIFSQYVSTLTVGIKSMSLQDCLNLTMYQLFDLMDRYSLYTSWDIDVRSRLAGAKIDSEPENWMKNIH